MSSLTEKLARANDLKVQLDAIKDEEAKLRREICDELLAGLMPGTHKFAYHDESGLTYNVKATKSFNYSLDQNSIKELMDEDELTPEELDCISIKYQLSLSNYKKLNEVGMLDDAITVTDAMPTLSIEIV
jgi:hypothetical protein